MGMISLSANDIEVLLTCENPAIVLSFRDHLVKVLPPSQLYDAWNWLFDFCDELESQIEDGSVDSGALVPVVTRLLMACGWHSELQPAGVLQLAWWDGSHSATKYSSMEGCLSDQEKLFRGLAPFIADGGRIGWFLETDNIFGGRRQTGLWRFDAGKLLVEYRPTDDELMRRLENDVELKGVLNRLEATINVTDSTG